jgi:hypothetical protein
LARYQGAKRKLRGLASETHDQVMEPNTSTLLVAVFPMLWFVCKVLSYRRLGIPKLNARPEGSRMACRDDPEHPSGQIVGRQPDMAGLFALSVALERAQGEGAGPLTKPSALLKPARAHAPLSTNGSNPHVAPASGRDGHGDAGEAARSRRGSLSAASPRRR